MVENRRDVGHRVPEAVVPEQRHRLCLRHRLQRDCRLRDDCECPLAAGQQTGEIDLFFARLREETVEVVPRDVALEPRVGALDCLALVEHVEHRPADGRHDTVTRCSLADRIE